MVLYATRVIESILIALIVFLLCSSHLIPFSQPLHPAKISFSLTTGL